jgi:hypothetical protein
VSRRSLPNIRELLPFSFNRKHWPLQAASVCRMESWKCAVYDYAVVTGTASQCVYVFVGETDNFVHAIFVVQVFTMKVISF